MTNAKSKAVLLAAMVVGMMNASSLYAEEKSWKDETVLISPQGDQTVVRVFDGDKVLFKNVGPHSPVQVNDGATPGGNGTIGVGGSSAVVNVHAGGTITPGSGVGTLTARDGMTLHDGAKLVCELGTTSDLLKITGGPLTGSGKGGVNVRIVDSGGLKLGKTYDLIDWTGATAGGVDVDDFVVDKASEYLGKFNIDGNRRQITITQAAVAKTEVTKAAPTAAKATTVVAKAAEMYSWTNPNGGAWADHDNWCVRGKITLEDTGMQCGMLKLIVFVAVLTPCVIVHAQSPAAQDKAKMDAAMARAELYPELANVDFKFSEIKGLETTTKVVYQDPRNIMRIDGKYHVWYTRYPNTGKGDRYAVANHSKVWLAVSEDGWNWTEKCDVLEDSRPGTWHELCKHAPYVIRVEGKYYMFYTARFGPDGWNKRIGLAIADNPAGPFKHYGDKPLLGATAKSNDGRTIPLRGAMPITCGPTRLASGRTDKALPCCQTTGNRVFGLAMTGSTSTMPRRSGRSPTTNA
jgi:hypothetical protein